MSTHSMPRRTLVLMTVVAVAVGLATAVAASAAPGGDRAQARTIPITLTEDGIQVPSPVDVRRGEELVWESELPFAVDIEHNDRLFGRRLPPQALRGRGNAPARAMVGQGAPFRTYKYSVAVWDGENVWVVDPEIRVRPN